MCSSYHAIHKVLHSLDAMVIVQALEAFLGARREWLLSALQMSTASGMDSADAASTRLAVIAAQVQVCSLHHAAQILLWPPQDAASLLATLGFVALSSPSAHLCPSPQSCRRLQRP